MNLKKKLAVALAFVIMIVIFAFSVYLVLSREAENEKKNVASMTDAFGTRLLVAENIVDEQVTEEIVEITTEELTTEQHTTESATEITTEITTESTTEEIVYEETCIYDSSDESFEYSDYDYGYEEESYGEEPDDSYVEPEEEYVEESNEDPGDTDGMRYYGTMRTTAYEWTGDTCADGRYPELGYTAACNDPNLWGHWIYIGGVGERYIHDTGDPDVMGTDTVDIYMGDVDTCYQYGNPVCDIYIID